MTRAVIAGQPSNVIKSRGSDIIHIVLIFASFVAYGITVFYNVASNILSIGIFNRTNANISDEYPTPITPAGVTFSVWGVIYIWQGAWLIFDIVTVFAATKYGPIYKNPSVLTPLFHAFWIINCYVNINWLFQFADLQFVRAFWTMFAIMSSLYVLSVISHGNVFNAESYFLPNYPRIQWSYRILVNNGITFYATWITVAFALSINLATIYSWGGSAEFGAFAGLLYVAAILITFFVLSITSFAKQLEYTYSPYLMLNIALIGILGQNWDPAVPSAIFTALLLAVTNAFLIVKILFQFYSEKREDSTNNMSINTNNIIINPTN